MVTHSRRRQPPRQSRSRAGAAITAGVAGAVLAAVLPGLAPPDWPIDWPILIVSGVLLGLLAQEWWMQQPRHAQRGAARDAQSQATVPTSVRLTPFEEQHAPPGSASLTRPDSRHRDPAVVACRLVAEVLNAGDLTVVDELFAPTFCDHSPRPGQGPGIAGYKQGLIQMRHAFPDLVHELDDLIVAEDRAVLRLTARGTHRGPFLGIPPTNRPVLVSGVLILRMAQGKVVERWSLGDDLGFALQLSPVPPPSAQQARSAVLVAYPHLPAVQVAVYLN